MENIAKRKEEEALNPKPKRPRGRPRGSKNKKLQPAANLVDPDNYPRPVKHAPPQPVNRGIPQQTIGGITGGLPPQQYIYAQPPPPQQPQAPVNNYYYYGAPPPEHTPPQLTRQVTYAQSSSEEIETTSSEEEVEYEVMRQDRYIPPPQPSMKYRFG